MKIEGKLLNWNDDRGFGFVEPNGGGERAFVHIKAFKYTARRPVNGDAILYELVRENNNRYKAKNIKFASTVKNENKQGKANGISNIANIFTIIFCNGLLVSVFSGKIPVVVIGLYCVMSLVTFIAYAIDKSAAKKGRWRTKESTLHLFSLMGGWPGAYLAQTRLRHKSSKNEFKRVYWITVLLNLGGLFWLYTESGAYFLNTVITPLFNGQ